MGTTKKDTFNCKFGANLQAVRERKSISQAALAKELGLTSSYIAFVEQGRRGVSLPVLMKLAKALDADPADLLKGL